MARCTPTSLSAPRLPLSRRSCSPSLRHRSSRSALVFAAACFSPRCFWGRCSGIFALTGAVIAAALVASTIVRETFGYSFSTWRLHLRGETIKSARDVGWVKTLTAGRMMRRETRATPDALSIAEFRHRYPLGSTSRVVLCDGEGHYAGVVQTAAAYAEGRDPAATIATLAANRDVALTPEANIVQVMALFDSAGSDELAVLAPDLRVLGILSETYVRRRYAEELEKAQRDLFRE
jgi:CIC family chloride channel protein